jgi:small-conductance mechanosensitive channel
LFAGAHGGALLGQTNDVAGVSPDGDQQSQVRVKLAAAKEDFNRAQATQTNILGATVAEVVEYRSTLQQIVLAWQFQLDDLAAMENVRARVRDLEQSTHLWGGFAEPPPYSVLMVDELQNAIQSGTAKIQSVEVAWAASKKFLADAELAMKEADGKIRRMDEQIETAKSPAEAARLAWLRELECARYRLEAANTASCAVQIKLADSELTEARQRLAFIRRQLALASQQVHFPQADLDKVLEGLDDEHRQLEAEIQSADDELTVRQQALAGSRESLRLILRDAPVAATNAVTAQNLRDSVEMQSLQAETAAERLKVLREMQANVGVARQLWQLRFAIFGNPKLADLQDASQRLARLNDLIEAAMPYYRQQAGLAANQIAEEQTRRQGLVEGAANAGLVQARLESYRQREEIFLRASKSLERHQRFVRCWQESIVSERAVLPFAERVKDLFSGTANFLTRLWHFEIFVVEDTITTMDGTQVSGRRGVTVGKICLALFIFLVGLWLTGVISRIVEPIAVRRLKIEQNQASLIRRWVRAVLVIALVIFSLKSVNIPLAVFAFAGGALAIGVGFGTQTLLKNFISGIILLFERPFRIGDMVDVQGQYGTVSTIGIRSCIVHLLDGKELLIPNSVLLENIVTNWTYSNRIVRFTIKVGVAYGSDTRRVTDLLVAVAGQHKLVQKGPPPQALLVEFGDSGMNFELRYWIDVKNCSYNQVASDLRHGIVTAFVKNHIAIAFPQRDVLLDSRRPLQVQVLPTGKEDRSSTETGDDFSGPRQG